MHSCRVGAQPYKCRVGAQPYITWFFGVVSWSGKLALSWGELKLVELSWSGLNWN